MKCNQSIETRSGAITVFFSIIFLSLILLTMTTVDAIRIEAAKVDAQRAMNIAGRSMLTEYNFQVANDYGIIGFDNTKTGESFEQYLEANLPGEDNSLMSEFYDINVKEGSVVQDDDALTTGEIRYLILEYMKFRAPLLTLTPFLEKLESVVKAGKTTAELTAKVEEVDGPMKDLSDLYEELRMYLEGWYIEDGHAYETGEKYVNLWDEASLYNENLVPPQLEDLTISKELGEYYINRLVFQHDYEIVRKYKHSFEDNFEAFEAIISDISDKRVIQINNYIDDGSENDLNSKISTLTSAISALNIEISNAQDDMDTASALKSSIETQQANLPADASATAIAALQNAWDDADDAYDDAEELKEEKEDKRDEKKREKDELEADKAMLEALKIGYESSKSRVEASEFDNISYILIESSNINHFHYDETYAEEDQFTFVYEGADGSKEFAELHLDDITMKRPNEDDSHEYDVANISYTFAELEENADPEDTKLELDDETYLSIESFETQMDTGSLTGNYVKYTNLVNRLSEFLSIISLSGQYVNRNSNQLYREIEEYKEFNEEALTLYEGLKAIAEPLIVTIGDRIDSINANEAEMMNSAKEQMLAELKENRRVLIEILGTEGIIVLVDGEEVVIELEEGEEPKVSISDVLTNNLDILESLLSTVPEEHDGAYVDTTLLSFVDLDIMDEFELHMEGDNSNSLPLIGNGEYTDFETEHVTITDFLDETLALRGTGIEMDKTTAQNFYSAGLDMFSIKYHDYVLEPYVNEYKNDRELDKRNKNDYISAESLITENLNGEVTLPEEAEEGELEDPPPTDSGESVFDNLSNIADGNIGSKMKTEGVLLPQHDALGVDMLTLADVSNLYSTINSFGESVQGAPPTTPETSELDDTDTEDSTASLNVFADFAESLSGVMEAIRNEVYINEYVMVLFKNRTTGTKFKILESDEATGNELTKTFIEENNIKNDVDFAGNQLIKIIQGNNGARLKPNVVEEDAEPDDYYTTPLEYEVEYVLSGYPSDSDNIDQMKLKLLMIRIPLNLIYLYTHSPERDIANSAATVLSFGVVFLVPVIQFLILFTWAYAESEFDIRLLYNGWKVPFMKSSDTFNLTFNAGKLQSIVSDGVNSAISAGAKFLETKLKDITEVLKGVISGKIDEINAQVTGELNIYIDQVVEDAEAYARTYIEDYTRSLEQYIKGCLNKMKDEGNTDIEYWTVDGYSDVVFHITEGGAEAVYQAVKIRADVNLELLGDLELITDFKINEITTLLFKDDDLETYMGSVVTIAQGNAETYVADTVTAIEGAITEEKDKFKAELGEMTDEAAQAATDAFIVPIDKVQGKMETIINEKSQELATASTDFIMKNNPFDGADIVSGEKPPKSFISAFKFKYDDYLRLFLLLTDEDKKMARIIDLIQLDSEAKTGNAFNAASYSVAFNAEASFEIEYLFIPWVYNVISNKEMTESKTTIKLKTYEGY